MLVPGIQGRWEYAQPTIAALAESCRVITFSLCGERSSGLPYVASKGLDNFADQIEAVLDDRGIRRAALCGLSFGGLAALRFAATRPDRTLALVLVCTPGPSMRVARLHRGYMRAPRLAGPLFLAATPWRLSPEIRTALPGWTERAGLGWRQLRAFLSSGASSSQMAARAALIGGDGIIQNCASIVAPTLVVTGEEDLDRVVPVATSLEYAGLIRSARTVRLDRTGHVGYLTKPHLFARTVVDFVAAAGSTAGGSSFDAA